MPNLTEEEHNFVQCLIKGMTGSDSYRASFDKWLDWQPSTVWAEASRLKNSHKVRAWLNAARQEALIQAATTFEDHLTELERLKLMAIEQGNMGAAIQAEQLRGKAMGYQGERIEISTPSSMPHALLDEEAEKHGIEWAMTLAKEEGITDWTPKGAEKMH